MFSPHILASVAKSREPQGEQLCIAVHLIYIIDVTLVPRQL